MPQVVAKVGDTQISLPVDVPTMFPMMLTPWQCFHFDVKFADPALNFKNVEPFPFMMTYKLGIFSTKLKQELLKKANCVWVDKDKKEGFFANGEFFSIHAMQTRGLLPVWP